MGIPILDVLNIGGKLIDHFFPDPKQKADAQAKLLELAQAGDLAVIAGQTQVNAAEAANPNVFVSGWRPFIGWVSGSGLALQFVIGPLFTWGAALIGHPTPVPQLDMGTLTTLLIGMLGLGGMRTVEKLQGAAGNH